MVAVTIQDLKELSATRSVSIPDRWNELSGAQLVEVARILFNIQDTVQQRLALVQLLFSGDLKGIAHEDIVLQLFPLADFLLTGCDLTEQQLPKLYAGMRRYYGPDKEFDNLTMVEFNFAEQELYAWHQDSGNMHQLWRFVATLYRPKQMKYYLLPDRAGDQRQPYNYNQVEKRARRLAKHLPVAVAHAILLWYKGCRQLLPKLYPKVFKHGEGSGATETPDYFDVIRGIAKDNTYGNFEYVEQMSVHTVMREIHCKIVETEQLIEQTRKTTH